MVKPEKFGYLQLVYHFTVPLTKNIEIFRCPFSATVRLQAWITVLKTSIIYSKPQKIPYREYKNFDSAKFNDKKLKYVLTRENYVLH